MGPGPEETGYVPKSPPASRAWGTELSGLMRLPACRPPSLTLARLARNEARRGSLDYTRRRCNHEVNGSVRWSPLSDAANSNLSIPHGSKKVAPRQATRSASRARGGGHQPDGDHGEAGRDRRYDRARPRA